jgi:hypothetical protein
MPGWRPRGGVYTPTLLRCASALFTSSPAMAAAAAADVSGRGVCGARNSGSRHSGTGTRLQAAPVQPSINAGQSRRSGSSAAGAVTRYVGLEVGQLSAHAWHTRATRRPPDESVMSAALAGHPQHTSIAPGLRFAHTTLSSESSPPNSSPSQDGGCQAVSRAGRAPGRRCCCPGPDDNKGPEAGPRTRCAGVGCAPPRGVRRAAAQVPAAAIVDYGVPGESPRRHHGCVALLNSLLHLH